MSAASQSRQPIGQPTIALISATFAAVEPAARGFADEFPDAVAWNIVDDRLLAEADLQGGVTPALRERMVRLIQHAITEGADGVLLTCSLYGEVVHSLGDQGIPVLAADDAAFAQAIDGDYERLLVVGSLAAAVADSTERLRTAIRSASSDASVVSVVAPDALKATTERDIPALRDSLAVAIAPHRGAIDAVVLAQYSLAPAADHLRAAFGIPVVSGPHASAAVLREVIADRRSAS